MSDGPSKKAEIERRLRLAKYPRRTGTLVFDDENDHNPLVLEDCPRCDGRGTICDETTGRAAMDPCPRCEGSGTTTELVRFFTNDSEEVEAALDEDGWVTCPCGRRFSTRSRDSWTGRRHKGCGQLIKLRASSEFF